MTTKLTETQKKEKAQEFYNSVDKDFFTNYRNMQRSKGIKINNKTYEIFIRTILDTKKVNIRFKREMRNEDVLYKVIYNNWKILEPYFNNMKFINKKKFYSSIKGNPMVKQSMLSQEMKRVLEGFDCFTQQLDIANHWNTNVIITSSFQHHHILLVIYERGPKSMDAFSLFDKEYVQPETKEEEEKGNDPIFPDSFVRETNLFESFKPDETDNFLQEREIPNDDFFGDFTDNFPNDF